MSAIETSVRVLRLLPVLSTTITLMFAVDEHIFLGTWMHPSFLLASPRRWVIKLGYPSNYILGLLNLVVARDQLHTAGSRKWYVLGLLFSVGHVAIYARRALKLLAEIENDVPKGNSTYSMGIWLKMNWVRAVTTDLPALLCFVVAALKTL
ncbi:hypothetical protein LAWI1_G008380 [Lachnellula willkommii]|uniref:Integral membrane protein n=1 Tax=Lachnellula willkommii TaxID=215461 RepID=A0A559M811_9HELO|nr:hypothetical protein LAWI1_G008380 [Lachnellula willkommii]